MNLLWIIILGILLEAIRCQKSFRYQCCKFGKELATNSGVIDASIGGNETYVCSRKNIKEYIIGRDANITRTRACIAIARSCCLKVVKTEVCRLAALEDGDCESIAEKIFVSMSDIKLECCLCCQSKNPISMDALDNCGLLKGKCPQKLSKTTGISADNTSDVNATMAEQNVSDSSIAPISSAFISTNQKLSVPWATNRMSKHNSQINQSSTESTAQSGTLRSAATTSYLIMTTIKSISCDNGYQWNSRLHVCVQMMISCPKKFVLHPDSKRCVPVIFPNIPCLSGFSYNQFKNKCIDIDECQNPVICVNKAQVCVNMIGSYKCDCIKGFKLNKMGICEDIDECSNSNICPDDKKCKNRVGTYKCVRAIPCGFGWREDSETNECVDIDECESIADICGFGMKCVNIRGSHMCEDEECPNNMRRNNKGQCSQCRDGFKMNNATNECEDIDECTEIAHFYKGRCKDSENCINLPGSYECVAKKKCRQGTLLTKNGTSCEDIDECKEMTFRCDSDDICINTYSSFQCVASPCAPSQSYDYKTHTCICKEGYRQSSDNNCEDIDECTDNGSNVQCGTMYHCVNKPGGYVCINKINCTKGMYRPSANSICQDIDECETGEGKCPRNMQCVNIVGSYKCMCNRGFIVMSNGTCADINECLLFRPEESCPDLEARCVNTPGSYTCQCPKGFEWSDYPKNKCIDIDECKGKSNPCGQQHTCINIIGSYKCQCHTGYRLTEVGDKCEDIDECSITLGKCINGRCINIPGRYTCECAKGFQHNGNEVCKDTDECLSFPGICPMSRGLESSIRCINLLGYYKCVNNSCPNEYSYTQSGNGYVCMLSPQYHCELQNVGCLRTRPYRKTIQFFEISQNIDLPRTLTRINVGHLPLGNQRINLQVKYAQHTDTKEPISIQNSFRLSRRRNLKEEIEIILQNAVVAPSEVLLYFETSVYHRDLYLGHSEAFISLYFTKYPDILV